ncbi:MAG: site-2 protease family protein [archaeon]
MLKAALGLIALAVAAALLWTDRKNIERSSVFFVRRTKKGIYLLDRLAKIPGLRLFYSVGIPLCLLGILYILLIVGSNAIYILTHPAASPGLAPIIPGVRIPGSPVYVPLGYGILGLFILLIVHEGSHGITARLDKIKVKSTGLLLALAIPGAFVEPDKNSFERAKTMSKLRVAAAGSFANILTAGICVLLIVFALSAYSPTGVVVVYTFNDTPAFDAFNQTTVITHFEGERIRTVTELGVAINRTSPNQTVSFDVLQLDDERVVPRQVSLTTIHAPNNTAQSYVGLSAVEPVAQGLIFSLPISSISLIEYVNPLYWSIPQESYLWYVLNSLKWIAFLNFAIGAVNLLPVQPLDGGLMVKEIAKKVSAKYEKYVTGLFSLLVVAIFALNLLPYFL